MTLTISERVSLRELTTLQVGGAARYFVTVANEDELRAALLFSREQKLPYFILGGGSNTLVSDEGYHGVVIQLAEAGIVFTPHDDHTVHCEVKAGLVFDEVVAETVRRGWWGLENLSGIPGSVGATPVQNVGAYGVEVANYIETVTVYDCQRDTVRVFRNEDCQFAYRDSYFKTTAGKQLVITAVTFRLSGQPSPKLQYPDLQTRFGDHLPTQHEIRTAVLEIRANKFPDWRRVGTAGSFFKNPIVSNDLAEALAVQYPALPMYLVSATHKKIPLGYVLDKICHLKGYRVGPVRLYENQALVLVAEQLATADDINRFAVQIAKKVYDMTGITIEREVGMLGKFVD